MSLGANIEKARRSMRPHLSQKALGKAVGKSVVSVRNWERDVNVPRADTLIEIANALNTTPAELWNDQPK